MLRIEDAETTGGDWDEVLRNQRINRRILPSHLSYIFSDMVSKGLAAYEPPKQTRSILVYWRLPEEWAEVLHGWVSSTAQLNTIMTFYEITDPPIESPLTDLPLPLLRQAITILGKTGRAQMIGVADGEGVSVKRTFKCQRRHTAPYVFQTFRSQTFALFVVVRHCHCIECISKFKKGPDPKKNPAWKPKCPQCGINIKNDQGIPLYLQFSDSIDATESYITRAGDHIDSLGSKLNADDTTEVGAMLTKVVDAVVEKQAILTEKTVGKLLRALARFQERITPRLMQLEEHEAAVKELRAKIGPLEKSEAYYRSGFDRAAELAEQSSRRVKELRENVDRYEKERRVYEEIKNERDDLKEEVRRLQGNCEAYNGKQNLARKKLKAFKDENKRLIQRIEHLENANRIEDSLQIGDYSQYYELDIPLASEDKENDDAFDDEQSSKLKCPHPQPQLSKVSRSSTSINRNPFADHPAAPIMQDDLEPNQDIDFAFVRYKSNWNLLQSKKRKLEEELGDAKTTPASKLPFPLNIEKGRLKGAAQVGQRLRLNKHN
ncbi:hypothetical protein HWV62_27870 [Athelia sp. TMB]|nr:hypothetical protein HWV62_27870 [Athelia sp. TMB]